jgi:UDP-3-O-[3-hydroxymyristoyl] glucosamine N-acyltransferase LpxD
MKIELNDIFDYLERMKFEYKYYGKRDVVINCFSALNNLKNNSITWIKNCSYYKKGAFSDIKDVLIVANTDVDVNYENNKNLGFILCNNPKQIFFSILKEFFKQTEYEAFISPHSIIETKEIGLNVYIGHNCYIGNYVTIDDNVIIKNNVSIEGKVKIGKNTVINSGVSIGNVGFGYFKNSDGIYTKVPHYGGVIIGNNVEIGANTCIDRGILESTVIGNNVKINNLCHIAHNVKIHDYCIITAGVIICGSTEIGKNTYIAPGAIIKNQLTIGENSLIGMGAVVLADVEDNKVVVGIPAKVIREHK